MLFSVQLLSRTDFYCVSPSPDSPVGLPEGFAEHFVKETFFKWSSLEIDQFEISEPVASFEIKEKEPTETNFLTSESYNGATFDNYTWSQTIADLDITIKLPENITSKNLKVTMLAKKISVKIVNPPVSLLDGELCHKIKHNEVIWSLDKRKLLIHLEKTSEIWWNCLILTEPKLDLTKMDCSRPYEELPEEAQAKIEELTWNQERKRLGLPTSDQLAMQETLSKAWHAEGSPFEGPFDPNSVIIN